jgi:Alpha/beta hydrolase family
LSDAVSTEAQADPDTLTPRPRRWPRRLVLGLLALVALVVVGFLWFAQPQPLLPEATAALVSTPDVTFTEGPNGRLTYTPVGASPTTGLILYPGGKVPPAAYAPQAQTIAEPGYLVSIVAVPFGFAVFDIDAAQAVIDDHPEITTWVVGGHSLGGAMAGQFIAGHPGAVDGLVLWASYSAADISTATIPVLSTYGTLDPGAPSFTSDENLAKLGQQVTLTPITGGNHEQMGWYTGQPNDAPATISRTEQQRQVIEGTLALLGALDS